MIAKSALIALGFLAGLAHAHWLPERAMALEAYSRTAAAITGDVVITKDALKVSTGKSLPWVLLTQRDERTLFSMLSAQNPELINGNRICGAQGATHALLIEKQNDIVSLHFFRASDLSDPIKLLDLDQACAIYNYTRAPDSAN